MSTLALKVVLAAYIGTLCSLADLYWFIRFGSSTIHPFIDFIALIGSLGLFLTAWLRAWIDAKSVNAATGKGP